MQRHYPNCLSLPVKINQKSGLLLMATACPISALDRNSATKFGLVVRKNTKPVRGSLGTSNEHLGMSELKNLVVANGADLSGVRVAVLNLANLNEWRSAARRWSVWLSRNAEIERGARLRPSGSLH